MRIVLYLFFVMMKCISSSFATLSLLLFLSPISFADKHDNPGSADIFYELGLEFPENWQDKPREERHEILQSLGIKPSKGEHYKGKVGDISGYFEVLNLEQPENWKTMSFEEKNDYVMTSDFFQEEKKSEGGKSETETKSLLSPEELIADQEAEVQQNEKNSPPKKSLQAFVEKYKIPLLIAGIVFLLALLLGSFFHTRSIRRILQIAFMYILPVGALLFSLLLPIKNVFLEFGSLAEQLLILILFVKPLAVILQSSWLMKVVGFRRELGILCFWFFLFHAAGFIYLYGLTSFEDFLEPYLFWGAVAAFGMILLGITSNNFSLKLLKKNWKRLQCIAYPVLFFTLLHSGMSEGEGAMKAIVIGGIFLVLKFLQWKGIRFPLAKLRKKAD